MGDVISPGICYEEARGCGFRKEGGLYLRGSAGGDGCGKLPILIPEICPTCGEGIRASRAPRLLADPAGLWNRKRCRHDPARDGLDHRRPPAPGCESCPFGQPSIGQALIIWVGERFYPSPSAYVEEARRMGISRRIPSVPRGFVVGRDYVLLAHKKCFSVNPVDEAGNRLDEVLWMPGIIGIFKPDKIEIVVTPETSQEALQRHVAQGLTPVIVNKVGAGFVEWDQEAGD